MIFYRMNIIERIYFKKGLIYESIAVLVFSRSSLPLLLNIKRQYFKLKNTVSVEVNALASNALKVIRSAEEAAEKRIALAESEAKAIESNAIKKRDEIMEKKVRAAEKNAQELMKKAELEVEEQIKQIESEAEKEAKKIAEQGSKRIDGAVKIIIDAVIGG